jgi:hypothetical protein
MTDRLVAAYFNINLARVHKSWTAPAQAELFRRVEIQTVAVEKLFMRTLTSHERFSKHAEHGTKELLCGRPDKPDLFMVDYILLVSLSLSFLPHPLICLRAIMFFP